MTTVFLKEKYCHVCGAGSRYPEIGSGIHYTGSKDLDTRPSQMQRSSVYMWVQRCLSCGYCAPDISRGSEGTKEIVRSQEYRRQLIDRAYPETANSYLCRAMIREKGGALGDSARAVLYAAWVCDDNGFKDKAAECRRRAAEIFGRLRDQGECGTQDEETDAVLMVDLYRRAGEFERAAQLCEKELSQSHADETVAMLEFEQDLIEDHDTACHTSAEAFEDLE